MTKKPKEDYLQNFNIYNSNDFAMTLDMIQDDLIPGPKLQTGNRLKKNIKVRMKAQEFVYRIKNPKKRT